MTGRTKVQEKLRTDLGDGDVTVVVTTQDLTEDKGLADITDLKNEDSLYVY